MMGVLMEVIIEVLCVFGIKEENVNINAFNMATRINELKTLTRHRLSKFKCKLNGIKCN